jgi:hypothetical protein
MTNNKETVTTKNEYLVPHIWVNSRYLFNRIPNIYYVESTTTKTKDSYHTTRGITKRKASLSYTLDPKTGNFTQKKSKAKCPHSYYADTFETLEQATEHLIKRLHYLKQLAIQDIEKNEKLLNFKKQGALNLTDQTTLLFKNYPEHLI